MQILSHRGYWYSTIEKNTMIAFERSFAMGFGTETDLRDYKGKIVISHDMPQGGEMTFYEFLNFAKSFGTKEHPLPLALNIKADGMQKEVSELISLYDSLRCFVFDMSIPDMRLYVKLKVPAYTRLSDIEKHPVYFNQSRGVWLDNFSDHLWYDEGYLLDLLKQKEVCIVSPELHGYDPRNLWKMLRELKSHKNLALCTDKPEDAFQFIIKS